MPLSQSLPITQSTDLVTFTIKVNGTELSGNYQVVSINVNKEVNRIPMAKVVIYDGDPSQQDFKISNEDTLVPGAEIEILAGYHSDDNTIFNGIILRHSLKIRNNGSPVLILDCRDKAVKMTVARKNKYFYDSKDSDAIEEIIGNYSLDSDIEDTETELESIVQYDSTDWDFILSRMEANGKLCVVDNGKITAKKPDFTQDTVLDAIFGSTILEFDADLDARNQYQGLTAKTWDYSNQDIITADANEPGFDENGNISSSDLGDVLGISEYDLYSGEEITQDELQSLADARLMKARMSRCRGRVRFQGFGTLNPADLINIGGVGDRFNGKVFVSGVRHEISNGKWTTDVQFGLSNELFAKQADVSSPPAADMLPAIQGLQIGIVTDLENDPDSQDRVRVRLPIIDSNEDGIWTRVACLDAGNKRGTFFKPEIGDEVVVGFLNNDPRHAVLLGMLNSSAKPAPLQASNQNDEKGYTSRSGMKMIFNDSENSIVIDTPAGNKISLSEQDTAIKIADQNGNSITLDSSGISIESASNMTLKANGGITIEATTTLSMSGGSGSSSISAGADGASVSATMVNVSGSATTAIKGGLVTIN